MIPAEDLAHNPGMHSDQESNQWPLGLQAGAQATEPLPFFHLSLFVLLDLK